MTGSPAASSQPGVSARFRVSSFDVDWRHCSRTSDVLAKLGCGQERTTDREWRLAATVLNEALEFAYRCACPSRMLEIGFDPGAQGLTLSLRLRDDCRRPLAPVLAALVGNAASQHFEGLVLDQNGRMATDLNPGFGLLWLVSELGVRVADLELGDDGQLRLRLDLPDLVS